MKRFQWPALIALLAFVAGLVSAAVGETEHSAITADGTCQEGSPCPDREHQGDPCGPGCACTCCPGHAVKRALVERFAFEVPPASDVEAQSSEELHPKDVRIRVFHPPRA